MSNPNDFNHVGPWLKKKLKERKLSVGKFTLLTGYHITSATIFRWYKDIYRPDPETMKLVCETLSKTPIYGPDGKTHFEEVPWSEGLSKYTPKPKGQASPNYGK